MAERIVLHIGPMKSGTTYLQNVLRSFEGELRAAGWLYPRTWENEREVPSHERAIGGLVGPAIPWVTAETQAQRRPAWQRLQAAASGWPGPVLLSAEALAVMDGPGIATLLGALPANRFRIVITARSLGRVLPSSWQQHVRNGRTDSYPTYLAAIRDSRAGPRDGSAGSTFWRSYDLPDVVRRWRSGPGVEEVVVATLPPSGPPEQLWRRFRDATGLPVSLPSDPPPLTPVLAQAGATAAEALLVEALVRRLEHDGVPVAERAARARRVLVGALLSRPDRGRPLGLPGEWVPEVAAWAAEEVAALRALDVPAVGSLEDLLVTDRGVDGPLAPPEEVAEAAVEALLATDERPRPRSGFARRIVRRISRSLGRQPRHR